MQATPGTSQLAFIGHWVLPPLILHPFSGENSAEKLLQGSKASLMLHGLIPTAGEDRQALDEIIVQARVQELRMLFFLGKDVLRWIEQCVEFADRTAELRAKGVRAQSFSGFLVEHPPESISRKLNAWGVTDQRAVFSRAIGLTSALNTPPTLETLSDLFLKHYHRFVDYLYVCYQNLEPFVEISSQNFGVEIYASAEYSEMLSNQWNLEH